MIRHDGFDHGRIPRTQKRSMPHPVGTKLQRVCTVSDGFVVPFNLRAFAETHGNNMSELMRAIGMPVANMNNWQSMLKGRIPFGAAKALVIRYAPDQIEAWEKSIQGAVELKKPPCKITEVTAALAQQYDAKRAGAKFKLKDGSILTIASAAAEAVARKSHETEIARLDREARDAQAALEAQRADEARRLEADRERIASMPRNKVEVQTDRGPITIEMPADVPQGEREVYTGLILRLHHQATVAVREKAVIEMRMKGLEGQIDNLKQRLREVTSQSRELEVTVGRADQAAMTTISGVSTPRNATPADFEVVRSRVKVPELQRLIDDMQKGMNGSFPKGAAHIS